MGRVKATAKGRVPANRTTAAALDLRPLEQIRHQGRDRRALRTGEGDVAEERMPLERLDHGGLRRLVIGSVSTKVMLGSDTAVLLYRPPHE